MNPRGLLNRAMLDLADLHGPQFFNWPGHLRARTAAELVADRLARGQANRSASTAELRAGIAQRMPQPLGDFYSDLRDSVTEPFERAGREVRRSYDRVEDEVKRMADDVEGGVKQLARNLEKYWVEIGCGGASIAAGAASGGTAAGSTAATCLQVAGAIEAARNAGYLPPAGQGGAYTPEQYAQLQAQTYTGGGITGWWQGLQDLDKAVLGGGAALLLMFLVTR